jgi:hypothetical protein
MLSPRQRPQPLGATDAPDLIREQGSLAAYLWRFETPRETRPAGPIAISPAAIALSKDLKKRGWAFVGPYDAPGDQRLDKDTKKASTSFLKKRSKRLLNAVAALSGTRSDSV